MHNSPV